MSDQIIGAAPTATITSTNLVQGAGFGLGDRQSLDGKEWVYVQADGAITGAGYVCQIDENYQATMVSTTGDAIGDLIGVAGVAFADNDYGWLQVRGACVVRVAASAAANVRLNSTATAGQLDDDGSSSAMAIDGLVLTTANGGAAATAAAMLSFPIIVSVGESVFTDGVTPGTAAASKALVLDASKGIATITTATITTLTTDAISGGDASLGITGQAAAQGGDVVVTGGTSSTAGNAGGAAKLVGGTPGATSAGGAAEVTGGIGGATSGTGGAATITAGAGTAGNAAGGIGKIAGGAGQGTGAGGKAQAVGGASGAGATGNGGAAEVTGGAAASTNGNGGSVVLTGGAKTGTGVAGMVIERSVKLVAQGAQTAKTTSATLTAAEVLAGIITVNQGGGGTSAQQLPLATDMDTAMPDAAAGDAFDFSVINVSTVAAEDASVTTNTGWTLVGNMDIASNAAATDKSAGAFRARKTASGAWTLYRMS